MILIYSLIGNITQKIRALGHRKEFDPRGSWSITEGKGKSAKKGGEAPLFFSLDKKSASNQREG